MVVAPFMDAVLWLFMTFKQTQAEACDYHFGFFPCLRQVHSEIDHRSIMNVGGRPPIGLPLPDGRKVLLRDILEEHIGISYETGILREG